MIFRIVTFSAAGLIGTVMGIWTIDRDSPVVIQSYELLTPQVLPGSSIRVKYKVNRKRECQVHIDRILLDVNKVRGELLDVDSIRPLGPLGDDEYITEITVPPTFSPGPALYRTIPSYRCNLIHAWFWPIVLPPQDLPFTVLPWVPQELR